MNKFIMLNQINTVRLVLASVKVLIEARISDLVITNQKIPRRDTSETAVL